MCELCRYADGRHFANQSFLLAKLNVQVSMQKSDLPTFKQKKTVMSSGIPRIIQTCGRLIGRDVGVVRGHAVHNEYMGTLDSQDTTMDMLTYTGINMTNLPVYDNTQLHPISNRVWTESEPCRCSFSLVWLTCPPSPMTHTTWPFPRQFQADSI